MKKILLYLIAFFTIAQTIQAQRGQKIGYVDLEYILENIPEYTKAQNKLELKVKEWQKNLDKLNGEIKTMKINLNNEKPLLTDDLIEEREEDIISVEKELKKMELDYFSADGDLFFYRKLLVKPIQDQVYNAVQEIGKARGYEIIFDKSSDLIMLYTNKRADISDLVLRSILRTEKVKERAEQNEARAKKTYTTPSDATSTTTDRELSEEEKEAVAAREAKRQEAINKADKAKQDRLKKREAQQAEIERQRLEREKQRLEARKKLEENRSK